MPMSAELLILRDRFAIRQMTGADIRAWRGRQKITQAEAARRLGVAEGTYRGWEADRHRSPHYLMHALAFLEIQNHRMVSPELKDMIAASIGALIAKHVI